MNVIDTSRDATSEHVITTGNVYMNSPVEPVSIKNGRYATMFVIVAYRIAVASLVGPSQAATTGGWPNARSLLIASPATTGSSTSKPSAIISVAIETCCKSMPSRCIMPNVIASVTGIEIAINNAERHSQK